jgi:hypothetical protein
VVHGSHGADQLEYDVGVDSAGSGRRVVRILVVSWARPRLGGGAMRREVRGEEIFLKSSARRL